MPAEHPELFRGAIKWFNSQKGFGFIIPDSPSGRAADVFVHITQIQDSNIKPDDLYEGRRIEFSQDVPKKGRNKTCACNLRLLD